MPEPIIKVAVGTPLNQLFDYLLPADDHQPLPGQRVRVPFGRREHTGIIVALAKQSEVPASKLRTAFEILDVQPLLDKPLLELLQWAGNYYQHPPGEVFAAALPTALRHGAAPVAAQNFQWRITRLGREADRAKLAKTAKLQARLLDALAGAKVLQESDLRAMHANWRKIMAALTTRGWVARELSTAVDLPREYEQAPTLTEAQASAIADIPADGFETFLLEGVTGSGKTEVYLQLIQQQIIAGRQSLVLVPEIGLTPQLIDRFERRLQGKVVAMHSGLTDTQRLHAWIAAHDGAADVIIGTRSAIFTPLPRPGLIVIDEEHDSSYKQQDGFRYSARDLAVYRAQQLNIPVILGSATPAFETLHNALEGRYKHLRLPERPGSARQPDIHTIDLRQHPLHDGLSQPLIDAMRRHLEAKGQALIYLNRRGYAPTLLCPTCGVAQECVRCDARMVLHQRRRRLVCHHCGAERAQLETCPECQQELVPVGQGTERLDQALEALFPNYPLVRIDRDTTRRRGSMEAMLKTIRSGESRILLGTQMLTKGHDFPNVTFVGIIDSDQGLFGTDFRSSERLAQSILQVSGRAGRGKRPGEVWIQTWYPDHPLLKILLEQGYDAFATEGLAERRAAAWPPFSHIALLRAECVKRDPLFRFLDYARDCGAIDEHSPLRMLGPASSPMERRAGRYRGQLLIQSSSRSRLRQFLPGWRAAIAALPEARKIRWSLDVDPIELF